jgi:hypothetical protein
MDEVLRCYLITFAAPGTVDDGRDAIDRRVDLSIAKKIPGYEAYAVLMLTSPPREDANITPGLTKPADDMTAEGARTACN